ncbi:MAG TPA: DNA repair protein RadC [Thermoanaerobaculia bacterium]|nr:DNA repair protein RadC [Thermoanaerobaculia bacterium]
MGPPRAAAAMIREIPSADRPRERLLREGGSALSDAELLAVLLRTGVRGMSALELARELLAKSGGISGLLAQPPGAMRRRGLGEAKMAAVLAAVELARRIARADLPEKLPLGHPEAVARYLLLRYAERDQEVMGALFLDVRNRLLGERELFRGTLSRAAVEPRAVFKHALLATAAGVLLFHTHPSGDPSPSAEDLAFTRRMADAGELIGIRLLDHLVLGSANRWVSLRRRGGW